ncbi:MAG: phosphoribosylaminoimidazolesuccinocarboxamide synthase [Stomatobaculum sp.]
MEKREIVSDSSSATVYRTDDLSLLLVLRKDTLSDSASGRTEEIPGKGAVCSRMSAHLFRLLETHGIHTAFVEELTDRECVFRAAEQLPFSLVIRNYSAGAYPERTGLAEGTALPFPVAELRYQKKGLNAALINGYDALALKLVSEDELETAVKTAFRINEILIPYLAERGMELIDLALRFGRGKDGILLTGELSPDTMRLWDRETHQKLDSERFLKELGNVQDAYLEVYRRLGIGELRSILNHVPRRTEDSLQAGAIYDGAAAHRR